MNSKKLMAGFSRITDYANKLSEETDFHETSDKHPEPK